MRNSSYSTNKSPFEYRVHNYVFGNLQDTFIFNVIPGESSSGNDKENTSLPERPKVSAFSPGRYSSGAMPIPIK